MKNLRRSSSVSHAVVGAAALAGSLAGCDVIVGLGEEPNAGSTSGAGSEASSGAGTTGTETGVSSGPSSSALSGAGGGGDGGDGGDGGGASSSSQSVSSGHGTGGGGSGAGGSEAPTGDCGACQTDADCANASGLPGSCEPESGRCRVRSFDVASDAVDPSGARGLPLRGQHAAFLKRNGTAWFLVVVDLEAGSRDEIVVVGGGSVVATDTGFAYLSLGAFVGDGAPGNVPSQLVLISCGAAGCFQEPPVALDTTAPYYSALGWLGDGRFITSINTGSGALRILSPRTDEPATYEACSVDGANTDGHAPFKFAVEDDLAAWSRVLMSGGPVGETIEVLSPTTCDGASDEHFTLEPRPSTIGIAIRGGDIAYTGQNNAWVNDAKVVLLSEPATPIGVGYVPGIAFRPNGTLLVPGHAGEAMWDCSAVGGEYRCTRYDLPTPGVLTDVYEITADERRVVTLSRIDAGYRVTCIDESLVD